MERITAIFTIVDMTKYTCYSAYAKGYVIHTIKKYSDGYSYQSILTAKTFKNRSKALAYVQSHLLHNQKRYNTVTIVVDML